MLASIYLDILLPVINERLRVLANKITLENIPIIIGADTNAWSKLWMAEEDNQRGLELETWIFELGLLVQNISVQDTFVTRRARSKIDVSMTKNVEISDWHVSEKFSFSDHRLIEFKADLGLPERPTYHRNIQKCNWVKFKDSLPTR